MVEVAQYEAVFGVVAHIQKNTELVRTERLDIHHLHALTAEVAPMNLLRARETRRVSAWREHRVAVAIHAYAALVTPFECNVLNQPNVALAAVQRLDAGLHVVNRLAQNARRRHICRFSFRLSHVNC